MNNIILLQQLQQTLHHILVPFLHILLDESSQLRNGVGQPGPINFDAQPFLKGQAGAKEAGEGSTVIAVTLLRIIEIARCNCSESGIGDDLNLGSEDRSVLAIVRCLFVDLSLALRDILDLLCNVCSEMSEKSQ